METEFSRNLGEIRDNIRVSSLIEYHVENRAISNGHSVPLLSPRGQSATFKPKRRGKSPPLSFMAHVHSLSSASTACTEIALLLRAARPRRTYRAAEKCRTSRNGRERGKGQRPRCTVRVQGGEGSALLESVAIDSLAPLGC